MAALLKPTRPPILAMMSFWLRGLIVWLGAALVGSAAGTLFLDFLLGVSPSRYDVWLVPTSLMFTVPGSALLTVAFAWLVSRLSNVRASLLAVLGLGVVTGGMTGLVGLPPILWGALYGGMTAIAWIALALATRMAVKAAR